jgi:hypothetical protein
MLTLLKVLLATRAALWELWASIVSHCDPSVQDHLKDYIVPVAKVTPL